MSFLLHIDTAVDAASVCVSFADKIIAAAHNPQPRESAAWLQPALQKLMQENNIAWQQIMAVSVSAGPGSYTGLRVGMASAKGLCFALNIPLITIGTLEQMSAAALAQGAAGADLLCPMIDARRMEVFTAIYNRNLEAVLAPCNMVVEADSFRKWLIANRICFFGNGADKVKPLLQEANAQFVQVRSSAETLVPLAFEAFEQGRFADLAYAEPMYVKDFFSTQRPA